MKKSDGRTSPTKLDRFLKRAGFSAGALSRAADMAPQHLSAIRAGEASPTVATIRKLVRAANKLSNGKRVTATDLFDFDDPETSGAKA